MTATQKNKKLQKTHATQEKDGSCCCKKLLAHKNQARSTSCGSTALSDLELCQRIVD